MIYTNAAQTNITAAFLNFGPRTLNMHVDLETGLNGYFHVSGRDFQIGPMGSTKQKFTSLAHDHCRLVITGVTDQGVILPGMNFNLKGYPDSKY